MKRLPLIALAVGAAAASASAQPQATSAPARSAACALLHLPPATRTGEIVMFGHVKSLTRKGNRFELRFDPAWWLTGLTARRAKLEDTGSPDVPNDYYIVDESHRLLTYLVPATARVTVLTNHGDPNRLGATSVSVVELAQLLNGKHPRHLRLTEPKAGFWLRIVTSSGTVTALDQQYQP
jgi:hypothetical protein